MTSPQTVGSDTGATTSGGSGGGLPGLSDRLYTQLVHLFAIGGTVALMVTKTIDNTTGLALLGGLVGIAMPSPFKSS